MRKLILMAILASGLLFVGQTTCRAQNVQTVPLYRLVYTESKNGGLLGELTFNFQHFYTTNLTERDSAIKNLKTGNSPFNSSFFQGEGTEGYLSPKQLPGTVPLYRLYKDGPKHFYTTDPKERDKAIGLGYKFESIVGYISTTQAPGTAPLFRMYRAVNGQERDDHFYTKNEEEKWTAIHKHKYADEGITGYVWTKAVTLMPDGKIASADGNPASNNEARKAIISSAYVVAMGRPATEAEVNYWLPRKESYDQLKDACRQWLYSPEGAKDLRETVIRAYEKQNNKKPTEDQIKFIIASVKPAKLVYDEIVKQLKS